MGNGVELPEGLVKKAAQQMLNAGDLSGRIRDVDGVREDTSRKEIWVLCWQISGKRWKATTVEPITIHGTVTCYGHSEAAACGSEMRMALIRALVQGGIHNTEAEAQAYVLHRVDLRVAHVDRLK